jgi:hypothetical protein
MAEPVKLYPCPRCRNPVRATSDRCGKCGLRAKLVPAPQKTGTKSKEPEKTVAPDPVKAQIVDGINPSSFGIASLLLTMTLIAVGLAIFIAAPGLGISMAILALPAFIRTLLVVRKRKILGRPVSTEAKVGLYLGSFGVTLVVTVVTIFASALTFCMSCLGGIAVTNGGSGGSETLVMLIAFGFTLAVAGVLMWAFSLWIISRWRRDTARL